MSAPTRVTKGMRFRHVIADCNALFEVKTSRGRGVWECEVVNEPYEINGNTYEGEYAGHVDVFDSKTILAKLRFADAWERMGDESDQWWQAQPLGSLVHYDNGFGQFVRGEIVINPEDGKHAMKRVALIGRVIPKEADIATRKLGGWNEYDLARRCADGTVTKGHQVTWTEEGKIMRPHFTSMYEAGAKWANGERKRTAPGFIDPTTLSPIDYRALLPTPDRTMLATEAKVRLLNEIAAVCNNPSLSEDARLAAIRSLLA